MLRYSGTTGTFLDAFVPAGSGGLDQPIDLVFGPDGHLYVTSEQSNEVLRYHGTTGAFLGAFVTAGSGGLSLPSGLAFGPDGNLYVADQDVDAVRRYNGTTGAFIDDFVAGGSGGLSVPIGLLFVPTAVPTLSEWAQVLMVALLIAGAWYVLARRRRVPARRISA